ncbi:MAG: hypothetical protein IT161_08535 [Bryobacterales bacterium]|nr:hypothetical protein [Bryobacterales bacterium]
MKIRIATLAVTLGAIPLLGQRTSISLNGEWKIADSMAAEPAPTTFPAAVPVPGLVHLSKPAFPDVDQFDSREFIDASIREKKMPEAARVDHAGNTRQQRTYFWYRRTVSVPTRGTVAVLRVGKAQFGTAVWVNGVAVGEHRGCFSAGIFDVTKAIRWEAANEITIRIGAHPAALPVWAPAGADYEKYKWTPGIYDDVTLHISGLPVIESVQTAPRIDASEVLIETAVHNPSAQPVRFQLSQKGGSQSAELALSLAAGERRTYRQTVKIPQARLWTPEDPFLYSIETSTGGDSVKTRFGMREFRFDTATKRAYLNGKLYFLRGSNITLHRFFEDPESKDLPWRRDWVRKLLVDYSKRMNWNSYRFCIGPVPDMWFDIADEAGLLVQNEFFIWNGRERFPPYRAQELITQYSEWMRDNWNHPSVAIWDASNETAAPVLRDTVIPQVRKLDLSNRPWENGYSTPTGLDDPVEDHPYLFSAFYSGRSFDMTQLERMTGAKTTNAGHPSGHAVIANEYGWLWMKRDGTPTLLTERAYEKLLGPNSTASQRWELYAYYLAGLTEFWRAHRNFAGVLHFTSLTCSYPGVKTGDHFLNLDTLRVEPNFDGWVRESFKPLGVYINFWQPSLAAGSRRNYSIMMVNDEGKPLSGTLSLAFERDGTASTRTETPFQMNAYGQHTWELSLDTPAQPGAYLLKAAAAATGEPTISRRKVDVR